jgi:hypothetical protein
LKYIKRAKLVIGNGIHIGEICTHSILPAAFYLSSDVAPEQWPKIA